jgi:hypothetical protein
VGQEIERSVSLAAGNSEPTLVQVCPPSVVMIASAGAFGSKVPSASPHADTGRARGQARDRLQSLTTSGDSEEFPGVPEVSRLGRARSDGEARGAEACDRLLVGHVGACLDDEATLILSWDGMTWSIVSSPSPYRPLCCGGVGN